MNNEATGKIIKEVQEAIQETYKIWKKYNAEHILQPLRSYRKFIKVAEKNRPEVYSMEAFQEPDVTGVWMFLRHKFSENSRIVVIDEDIEAIPEEEKNAVHTSIMKVLVDVLGNNKEAHARINSMYLEKTTSGGYHVPIIVTDIPTHSIDSIKSYKFTYNPRGIDEIAEKERIDAEIKQAEKAGLKVIKRKVEGIGHIELLGNGKNVVIAPSIAANKKVIGQHELNDSEFIINGQVIGRYTIVQGNSIPEDGLRLTYEQYKELIRKLKKWDEEYNKSPRKKAHLKVKGIKGNALESIPLNIQKKLEDGVPLDTAEQELLLRIRQGASEAEIVRHKGNRKVVSVDPKLDRYLSDKFPLKEILVKGGVCTEADYISGDTGDFVKLYSLLVPDGNNPDSVLYKNEDTGRPLMWDTHPGVNDVGMTLSYVLFVAFKQNKRLQEKFRTFENFIYRTFKYHMIKRSTNPRVNLQRSKKDYIDYTVDRYIDPQILANIVKDNLGKNILLVGETGMGKTTAVVKMANILGTLTIIAQPYAQQVNQTASTFDIPKAVQGVHQEELDSAVAELKAKHSAWLKDNSVELPNLAIVTTYDSFNRVEKSLTKAGYELKNCIVVIDESHSLVTSMAYRADAINALELKTQTRYRTSIFMTATPEVLEHGLDKAVKVRFNKANTEKLYNQYYLVVRKRGYKGIDYAVTHILNNHIAGKMDVIFENNIKSLSAAKRVLEAQGLKCGVVYSEIKQDSLFQQIIEESRIDDDIDVLLTTEVINDGININNDNINNIYIIDNSNGTKIRQFIGRFRKGMNDIHVCVSSMKTAADLYVKNSVQEALDLVAKELRNITEKKQRSDISFEYKDLENELGRSVKRLLQVPVSEKLSYTRSYYDNTTGRYDVKVKTMAVLHAVYNGIERELKHPVAHRKWMKSAYGINVKVIEGPDAKNIIKVDTKEETERAQAEHNEAMEDIYKDPVAWLKVFMQVNNIFIDSEVFDVEVTTTDTEYGKTGHSLEEVQELVTKHTYGKVLGLMLRVVALTNEIPPIEILDEVNKTLVAKLSNYRLYKQVALRLWVDSLDSLPTELSVSNTAFANWIKIFTYAIKDMAKESKYMGYVKRADLKDYTFKHFLELLSREFGRGVNHESIATIFSRFFNTFYNAVVKLDIRDTTKEEGRRGNKGRAKVARIVGITTLEDLLKEYVDKMDMQADTAKWLEERIDKSLKNYAESLWWGISGSLNLNRIQESPEYVNELLKRLPKIVRNRYQSNISNAEIGVVLSWAVGNDTIKYGLGNTYYRTLHASMERNNNAARKAYMDLYWNIKYNNNKNAVWELKESALNSEREEELRRYRGELQYALNYEKEQKDLKDKEKYSRRIQYLKNKIAELESYEQENYKILIENINNALRSMDNKTKATFEDNMLHYALGILYAQGQDKEWKNFVRRAAIILDLDTVKLNNIDKNRVVKIAISALTERAAALNTAASKYSPNGRNDGNMFDPEYTRVINEKNKIQEHINYLKELIVKTEELVV